MFDLSRFSENPCLIQADGTVLSYADVSEMARSYADGLDGGRGMLLLGCRNDVPTIVAYLGAMMARMPVMLADGEKNDVIDTLSAIFRPRYVQRAGGLPVELLAEAETELHEDLAVLLLTSGSTGAAKAVRLSHDNMAANAASIAEYLGLAADERAALTLPLHYSYGLSIINSHLSIGASVWLAEGSVLEPQFWSGFEQLRCTSFPGVPHSYQMLERNGFDSARLPSLRYATQAGGHLSADLVRHFGEMAKRDGWRFYVMYGQTEAAPRMSYVPPELILKHPDTIGVAIPGGEFRIDADEDSPEGVGELVYSGPNVMMGYAENAKHLRLGKGPTELRTGDIAVRGEEGLFKIVGRRSRFIKLFGLRISLDEVERWFAAQGIVAVAVGNDQKLAVFSEAALPGSMEGRLADWLKIPARMTVVERIAAIPRNASGKIDYPALRQRFEAGLAAAAGSTTVDDVFREFFPSEEFDDDSSFSSLGGDSLKFVQFSMELERLFRILPDGWEQLTVGQLRKSLKQESETKPSAASKLVRWLDTGTVIRAYAIICVITHHLDLWLWTPNGSVALLVLAGISLGRFQLTEVLRSDRADGIFLSVSKVLLPMFLWVGLNQLRKGDLFLPALFAIGNFWPPKSGFNEWFLEVYVQLFVVIGLLLSIPSVRGALRKAPFASTIAAFVFCVGLQKLMPFVWDADYLYDRVPHMMVWLLAAGLMISQAKSLQQKLIALALFYASIATYMSADTWSISLCVCVALVTLVPALPIPVFLRRPIAEIGAASLFIYLTHFQVAYTVGQLLGFRSPAISVITALVGGVLIARGYYWLEGFVLSALRANAAAQMMLGRKAKT